MFLMSGNGAYMVSFNEPQHCSFCSVRVFSIDGSSEFPDVSHLFLVFFWQCHFSQCF